MDAHDVIPSPLSVDPIGKKKGEEAFRALLALASRGRAASAIP